MKVELPFLAEGVEGGDVVQVLVHEGDQVTEGQSLIELETEKATVPVPAPAAGTVVRLLIRQGDHVKVGQALVELDGANGAAQQAKNLAAEKPSVPPAPQAPPAEETALAATAQRKEEENAAPTTTPRSEIERPASRPAEGQAAVPPPPSDGAAIAAPPSVRRLARE